MASVPVTEDARLRTGRHRERPETPANEGDRGQPTVDALGYHLARQLEVQHFPTGPASTDRRLPPPLPAEATLDLLDRVKSGDRVALDQLLERCIPALRRWAHGRLPVSARSMEDTGDLVQNTVISVLRRLSSFEARHQGALQAYLRQAVMNRIRDLVRQRDRRPVQTEMPADLQDDRTSPLESAVGAENVARYEAALARLRAADREAIVNRLELQLSYDELAVALDKPTAQAARVAVMRAMKRLAEEMRRDA